MYVSMPLNKPFIWLRFFIIWSNLRTSGFNFFSLLKTNNASSSLQGLFLSTSNPSSLLHISFPFHHFHFFFFFSFAVLIIDSSQLDSIFCHFSRKGSEGLRLARSIKLFLNDSNSKPLTWYIRCRNLNEKVISSNQYTYCRNSSSLNIFISALFGLSI